MPSVTVIVPCHNHANFVDEAIDGIRFQNYPNLRVVVIDDGSTDNSSDRVMKRLYRPVSPEKQGEPWVCKGKIVNSDVELMLLRYQKARGPAFARNRGIEVSSEATDLYAMLDADDTWMPRRVEICVNKWQENPSHIGLVYTDFDTINADGLRLRQFKESFSRERLLTNCIVTNACFISKLAFAKVGVYDESMRVAEDYDLFVRLSEQFMIAHIPQSTALIRVHPQNSSKSVPAEVWKQAWARIGEKTKRRMNVR